MGHHVDASSSHDHQHSHDGSCCSSSPATTISGGAGAKRSPFVHFHNHTQNSVVDGLQRADGMVDAAIDDGAPAIGISDHGTLGGIPEIALDLEKRMKGKWKDDKLPDDVIAARLANLPHPILGIEAYMAIGSRFERNTMEVERDDADPGDNGKATKTKRFEHLTLFAATPEGWRNLVEASSKSYIEGFFSKPRMDYDLLRANSRGVVGFTGCLGGPIAGRLARGDVAGAREHLTTLKEIFEPGNLFVEVMDHGIDAQRRIIPQLAAFAREFDLPVIATNDAHFTKASDARAHDAWLCLQSRTDLNDPDRWKFPGSGHHLRTAAEMRAIFDGQPGTERACDNTLLLAERIMSAGRLLPESRPQIPPFPGVPAGMTSAEFLRQLVLKGASERYGSPIPAEVMERVDFELSVIGRMHFCCPPGTAISMADGSHTAIESIVAGDEVVTHDGNSRVVYTQTSHFDGDLVEIVRYGEDTPLRVTPNHPVLTFERGWVDAGSLDGSEHLITPKRDAQAFQGAFNLIDVIPAGWDYVIEGDLIRRMRPGRWGVPRKALGSMPTKIEATPELMYLLGLYIAESCMSGKAVNGTQGEIHWTLGSHEPDLIERLRSAVESFGTNLRVYPHAKYVPGHGAMQCKTTNHPLALLMQTLAPGYSHDRVLHPWVMNQPPEMLAHLLRGWWDGDSSDNGNTKWIDTRSSDLARQGVDIVDRIWGPASRFTYRQTGRTIMSHRVIWRENRSKTKPHGRIALPDGGWACKIRRLSRSRYTGPVYNFEVAGQHSYVANGTVVHNCDYFLIEWECEGWARSQGIRVGPGRGSAAGSVVSYCLRIVDVDPIKNDLLFERFLNPDRISMPDIDVDFEPERRGEVVEHLRDVYGYDHVAHIGTFGTVKAKSAIKDAARVLGFDPSIGNKLSAVYPKPQGGRPIPIAKAMSDSFPEGAELRKLVIGNEDHEAIIELALEFEELIRSEGVHPCAVVITTDPVSQTVPLRVDKTGALVTQWDAHAVEDMGLLKFDRLGLANLSSMSECLRLIELTTGEVVDIDNPPTEMSDPRAEKTWKMIQAGDTSQVFQLESDGMQELCRRLKPTLVDDLTALVALYRPGPMSTGLHYKYADRKNGREQVTYDALTTDPAEIEVLTKVMSASYGTLVYQEQAMMLSRQLAGFTPGESDQLRKACGKKLKAEMDALSEKFITGTASEKVDPDTGEIIKPAFSRTTGKNVWAWIVGGSEYAFNKSHSAAYGWVAYQTAFLKANWPAHYAAALLTVVDKPEKKQSIFGNIRAAGIEVLPPSVNEGGATAMPVRDGAAIRLGLSEIAGLGVVADAISMERRANGTFASLGEMFRRIKANHPEIKLTKQHLDRLIKAGALDEFGPRLGLYTTAAPAIEGFEVRPMLIEWPALERLEHEREMLKAYTSGHPLTAVRDQVKAWRVPVKDHKPEPIQKAVAKADGQMVVTLGVIGALEKNVSRRGTRWAKFSLQGTRGEVDVFLWGKPHRNAENSGVVDRLRLGSIVSIIGRIETEDFFEEEADGVEPPRRIIAEEVFIVDVIDPPTLVGRDARNASSTGSADPGQEQWMVLPLLSPEYDPSWGADKIVEGVADDWQTKLRKIKVNEPSTWPGQRGGLVLVALPRGASPTDAMNMAMQTYPELADKLVLPASVAGELVGAS